ncbi:MAG TPA: hypothetical protein PLM79_16990 [Syntrophobacteraceae bacterium]|nr:hypothetical protein [Syntrophobacteraceae bacterium]
MTWRIDSRVEDLLKKGEDLAGLEVEEAVHLLKIRPGSREMYALMETADRISRRQFNGKGELHFHIGVNASPCPYNCRFCSLTVEAGVFTQSVEFGPERVLSWAREGQKQGADALNLMSTGTFPLGKLLEIGRFLRDRVSTPLVANTRDLTHEEGEALLEAGFVGAYHSVRLGEGRDTPFSVQKRIQTIRVLRDVGLRWMNCVEPVGPEHTPEEIAELMVLARRYGATYSGVMRRINFPGSPMGDRGMITEMELARMVAVSRLVMGDRVKAHCTHEPNVLSLIAGANLLFPEVGSSPRDRKADTGKGRGTDLSGCGRMLTETGWDPGMPSNCFLPPRA